MVQDDDENGNRERKNRGKKLKHQSPHFRSLADFLLSDFRISEDQQVNNVCVCIIYLLIIPFWCKG